MTKIKMPVGKPVEVKGNDPVDTANPPVPPTPPVDPQDPPVPPVPPVDPQDPPAPKDPVPPVPPVPPVDDDDKKIIIIEDDKEVNYTLNEAGDAVDTDGKVVYTAAQIEGFNDDPSDEDEATVESISKLSGIQVLDSTGKPVQYEMTVESLAQRDVDIKRIGLEEGYSRSMEILAQRDPELARIIEYRNLYGTTKGFETYQDFSTFTLDKDNSEQLISVIVAAEIEKGATPERAKRIANMSKMDETLFADATEAQTYLKTLKETRLHSQQELEQAQIQKQIDNENNYFGYIVDEKGTGKPLSVDGSIYDIVVNKGQLKGLSIPKEGVPVRTDKGVKVYSREEIFKYIYEPVKEINGELYTQAQLDELKRISNKEELVLTYIRNLAGGNLDFLVKSAADAAKVKTIKKVVAGPKQTPKAPQGGTRKLVLPVGNPKN